MSFSTTDVIKSLKTDLPQDYPFQFNPEEKERNIKHFAALLTGKTNIIFQRQEMKLMYSTNNPQNAVATGRFTFYKKNLYYSFYLSSKIMRPIAVQFINNDGNILEEHNLISPLNNIVSNYQNATGKICGVWRRIPRDYKKLLRDEKLFVVLLWDRKFQFELALAGKITRYNSLSTELFSSLLEPEISANVEALYGLGGTAIVSISSGAASSVHLTIVFNGLFGASDNVDVPISIKIELPEKKEIVLYEIQKFKKPLPELNTIEISSPISAQNLRFLSRGKLVLTVESQKYPNLKIQGHIITKITCELFQTLLTPSYNELSNYIGQSSGLAWMYLNSNGSLVYNIKTNEINSSGLLNITLSEANGRRKEQFEDLSLSFNFNQAIGLIDRLSPRILQALYSGDLGVNISFENNTDLIHGWLLSKFVADSRDSAEPILLIHYKSPSWQHNNYMGMAWVAIDNECNLHYEITISTNSPMQQIYQIYLEEKPIEAFDAPVSKKLLEEFSGAYLEGFVFDMPYSELAKLESSVCYLEIYSKNPKELLLRGKLKSTVVPSHCFASFTDNATSSNNMLNDNNDNMLLSLESKCYHLGRFYNEAEQWRSARDLCTMCSCQYSRVVCDVLKCPILNCKSNEHLITRERECCPTCISTNFLQDNTKIMNGDNTEKGCQLGNTVYLPGATWHPYLPPNGFDICTTCTCDPHSLRAFCPRIVCPPLVCSGKVAYRPDKKACCKVCPEIKQMYFVEKNRSSNYNNNNYLRDAGSDKGSQNNEVLLGGGCKVLNLFYENGQEWHPIIASHGEQKCVNCRCKEGKVTCGRKKCSRVLCNVNHKYTSNKIDNRRTTRKKSQKKEKIKINISEQCCTATQCRRERKHASHRKVNRDRNEKSLLLGTMNRFIDSKRS